MVSAFLILMYCLGTDVPVNRDGLVILAKHVSTLILYEVHLYSLKRSLKYIFSIQNQLYRGMQITLVDILAE